MDWFFVRDGVRGNAFDDIWLDERVGFSSEWTPAGPPAGPTSPWAVSLIRVPVSTPAGTSTVMVRRERTRPSPAHSVQGSGITVPKPWQAAQGCVVIT